MMTALVAHIPRLAPDLRFRLLVSPHAPRDLGDAPNVERITVKASANGPGTMWWLPRIADLGGVDLFHATFNILPAGLKMPCITTIHDLMWMQHPEWCDDGWLLPVRRAFFQHGMKRALSQSAFIATVSEATRDALIEALPQVAAQTKAIPSGVSRAFRPWPVDPSTLAALGLDPKRRFVLMVGQSAPYKNHASAIRGFAIACAEHEDVDLLLVQRQGRHSGSLLQVAASLGIADRVRILPAVAEDLLLQLYASAAALLHPSLCEGFGLPLAEAMACGCPVITSDCSAMPEVTGDAAVVVNPRDTAAIAGAIARVLNEPGFAIEMRKRGFARAESLNWEQASLAYIGLYRRILAASTANPPPAPFSLEHAD